jgi:pyruvate formate lyase activating enzyme
MPSTYERKEKMTNQIYTATGCARCKITKRYMKENGIDYEEYDFKADGKEAFSQFYRANRASIFRDKDGVEFPVFTDGQTIRQGVSVVIGFLIAGDALAGYIGRSLLHGEWIDGFDISGGDPDQVDNLLKVLAYLKRNGLKIQLTTEGRNAAVLQAVLDKDLADRVIMTVCGPAALYGPITGYDIDEVELKRSISLAAKFPEYRFYTTVTPLVRNGGTVDYLTPEEIGETAKLIEGAAGSKKHPYELRLFDPESAGNDALASIEPLPSSALFKYRTTARRYMVMAEIEK